jgi:hypothetical protein
MKLTGQLGLPSFKGFRFEKYWLKQRGFIEIVRLGTSRKHGFCPKSLGDLVPVLKPTETSGGH